MVGRLSVGVYGGVCGGCKEECVVGIKRDGSNNTCMRMARNVHANVYMVYCVCISHSVVHARTATDHHTHYTHLDPVPNSLI